MVEKLALPVQYAKRRTVEGCKSNNAHFGFARNRIPLVSAALNSILSAQPADQMKTTNLTHLALLLCLWLVGPISIPRVGAGAAAPPTRPADAPGAPAAVSVNPSAAELSKLNAALKALLAKDDPAIQAIFEKYPGFLSFAPASLNPPPNKDGNFIVGPNYVAAPESFVQPGVPQGAVYSTNMNSTDSKIYPGIARTANTFGEIDPANPFTLLVPTSHPAPWTRRVQVYVPKQYVPGTTAPFIVVQDGGEPSLTTVLDNLIAQRRIPVMIAILIANGGGDAQGSERGLEYDTMSGLYAEFVETEVLPLVEKMYDVKLTKDPEGRATAGTSSGGVAAFSMAWYHPELYHRVLTYSGTYVNQQWPFNPAIPHGAWEYHEHLIAESPKKPIRIWLEVGDRDLLNPNIMRDEMHDWVVANWNMVKVLTAKGYHYQFLFALNAGHGDGAVKGQTLPEALEWLWQDYPR